MSMSNVIKSIEREMFTAATEKDAKCKNCKYHDDFTWACFNSNSPYRADFTDNEFVCGCYEWRNEDDREKL